MKLEFQAHVEIIKAFNEGDNLTSTTFTKAEQSIIYSFFNLVNITKE